METGHAGIILSILTFAFVMYQQYFRSARLFLALGDRVALGKSETGHLAVLVDVSFVNRGAREAQVVSLTGVIRSESSGREVTLHWYCFTDSRQVALADGRYSPWTGFLSWPTTLLVPGRTGINRSVSLNTLAPVTVTSGTYSVSVIALGAGQHRKPLARSEFQLSIDSDDLNALARGAIRDGRQGTVRHYKRWPNLESDSQVYRSSPPEPISLVEL